MATAKPIVTVTPLHKHHGQHGGLIALGLLVASSAVVWVTHPREPDSPAPTSASPPAAALAAAASSVPQPAAAAVERAPVVERDASAVVRELPARITGTGFVSYDESRTSHIGAPVHGWLEKTRAKSVGRRVRQFETLAVVYSPEVYLASVDLIAQLRDFRTQEQLNQERWRLVRWGMPKPSLDRIEQTMKPSAALPLVTRVAGTVVSEHGTRAQLVDPDNGIEYFTITDPARYWVFVDVPEAAAPLLRVGMPGKLTIDGVARPLTANIAYVFRRPDEGMRKVRFDVYSPGVALKPNAHVTAELQLAKGR